MSHKRSVEDKRRLKKLSEESSNHFIGGAWFNTRKGRYERFYTATKWVKKYYTKYTRRKLKNNPYHLQGGKYKKVFDYFWTIC